MTFLCRICGSTDRAKTFEAREMMFGFRDRFLYEECASCQSLQIATIPDGSALAKYYPKNYYSYMQKAPESGLRLWARTQVDQLEAGLSSIWGAALKPLTKRDHTHPMHLMLAKMGLKRTDRVLDVGCGSAGLFLDKLRGFGMRSLLGCDPFIEADTKTPAGVPVRKAFLTDVEGPFDIITFHHSLEHVPDPVAELSAARGRLKGGGHCLVRIPTPSSELWREFGIDWVELDAPRHLHLISRDGMARLAAKTGFALVDTIDDEDTLGQRGSEGYRRDIPLREQPQPPESEFVRFRDISHRRNLRHDGGRAGFILKAA